MDHDLVILTIFLIVCICEVINSPKISVVVPNFNGEAYLEAALDSVLSQDYTNKELIVVDGDSSDNSVEMLRRYGRRLDHWVSEPDRGQSNAINKGLRRCSGVFCNWLNSDDILKPGALSAIADAIQSDPEADYIYGDTEIIGNDSTLLQVRLETSFSRMILKYGGNAFAQPSCFFRRKFVNKLNYLDEDLHWSMDYDLWIRSLEHGARFRQVKRVLSQFRLHCDSKTGAHHEKIRNEHYRCYRRTVTNPLLRAKLSYRFLKLIVRSWRVVRLYRERGVWNPGYYARMLKALSQPSLNTE